MSARGRAAAVASLLLAACAGAADPSAPFALEFTRLPWPSVVFGDTLRDSTGAVAPLRAFVFDAAGRPLTTATPVFVPLDTGVRLLASGTLVPTSWRTTPVRLVATATGLQTRPLSLLITRRPDTLIAASDTARVVRYDIPVTDATNLSSPVQVRLFSRQTIAGVPADTVTAGWIIRFAIERGPATGLVDSVQLVSESTTIPTNGITTRIDRDTTDASGTAGVRLRVFPRTGQTAADSVVLLASASYRGTPVPGSPRRLVVRLQRRGATP